MINIAGKIGLSKKDETIMNLLIKANIPKNIAKTLVFLSKKDETSSVDIESATDLRQPEVSIAMQELRRLKWVEKRDIKKEGKGRPVHAYLLAIPFKQIISIIEKDEKKRIKEIEANIKELKRLTK